MKPALTPKTKNATPQIHKLIHEIRGQRVMLDSDLAALYGVTTMRLNEAVKRNIERFPDDFMFRLTADEWENLISQIAISSGMSAGKTPHLRSQIVTSNNRLTSQIVISNSRFENEATNLKSQIVISSSHGGRRKLPYAFTEHGILMLSSVLRSEIATEVNIKIMRVFVQTRRLAYAHSDNTAQIAELRKLLALYIEKNDKRVNDIIKALNSLIAAPSPPAKPLIGFKPHNK